MVDTATATSPITRQSTGTTTQIVNPKNVPYKRSNSELMALRSNIEAAIAAGFNGWKDLFSSSNPSTLAYLDLSTTSRASNSALGQHIRTVQQGANEEDPDSSWMTVPDRHLWCAQSRMDCYC